MLPATAAERRPTEFGVCFHHAAFGDEYTPAAAAVLDDLRSAGTFWIRGDFQEPAKDARFAADMQRKGIQVLALLPWYSTDPSGWQAYVRKQVAATPDGARLGNYQRAGDDAGGAVRFPRRPT